MGRERERVNIDVECIPEMLTTERPTEGANDDNNHLTDSQTDSLPSTNTTKTHRPTNSGRTVGRDGAAAQSFRCMLYDGANLSGIRAV